MKTRKGSNDYVVFFVVGLFFALLYTILIPFGGSETLLAQGEDFNVSNDSLRFDPTIPNFQPETLDLQADAINSANVTFENISDINNPSFNPGTLESDIAVTKESGKSVGYVEYNIAGNRILKTWSEKTGLFEASDITLFFLTTDQKTRLSGKEEFITEDNKIRIQINTTGDYVYQIQIQEEENPGFLQTAVIYTSEALDFVDSFFAILTELPSYLYPVFIALTFVIGLLVIKIPTFA